MRAYRVGCMGWAYDDWRGPFYPPGTAPGEYLARYARVFDHTEVDSTFYRAPEPSLVARWAAATPPGFTFSLKLPGDLTHKASLRNVEKGLESFLDSLSPLAQAGKLGPVVAQLPASFTRDRDATALEEFLGIFPRDLRLAVELRHASWWVPATFATLRASGAALVWSVNQYTQTPPEATADFLYVRFVGDRELTKFDRVQRDLRAEMIAMKARLEAEGARDVYLLLNNHFMGFAPGTAVILQEVMGLPRADLSAAARGAGQRSLSEF